MSALWRLRQWIDFFPYLFRFFIRDAARQVLQEHGSFLFIPGVVLTAWIGGLGPGLLSMTLNTAVLWYFVLEPKNSFRIRRPDEAAILVLFAATCALISWLFESRLRSVRIQTELVRSLAARTEQLQIHEVELRRSNQDLEHFAHIVAHDLKEPLRSVHLYSELMLARIAPKLDPKDREVFDFILRGAERTQRLVEDLLAYSTRTSAQPLPTARVDMNEVARLAIENLRAAMEENEAVIEYGNLPVVQGDPKRLIPLLQNLIENALKYRSARRPAISLAAESANAEWIFCVSDNGIGFNAEYAEQIFEPLKRLHGSDRPGTGIGLAIWRSIVQAHGGRIWAESRVGQGSQFYFTLPVGQPCDVGEPEFRGANSPAVSAG